MTLVICPECSSPVSDKAPACPSCGYPMTRRPSEPQFEAHRKRMLTVSLVLCFVGLFAGAVLKLPFVILLAVVGIAINLFKLSRLRR